MVNGLFALPLKALVRNTKLYEAGEGPYETVIKSSSEEKQKKYFFGIIKLNICKSKL
ncbi:hypothetical protein GHK52_09605 [Lactococcus garvieae]|nr:hypothetical protein [Lactococcus garvieae]